MSFNMLAWICAGVLVAVILKMEADRGRFDPEPTVVAASNPEPSSTHARADVGSGRGDRLAHGGDADREDRHEPHGRPEIHGSAAFRRAIQEILDEVERYGSRYLRANVAMIRFIRELKHDGGEVLAFVYERTCDISVHPAGWRTHRAERIRVLTHESHHCWLTARGRERESSDHIGFEEFERRVAGELGGATAAWR